MSLTAASPTVIVQDVGQAKEFYATHFNARVAFDCGWYISLEFGPNGPAVQFMQPQSEGQKQYQGGLTLNLCLEDTTRVDAMHARLARRRTAHGHAPGGPTPGETGASPPLDPYGVTLYIYADTEPDEEFRQYFK